MSIKPSRSEIETALAGQAKSTKRRKIRAPNPLESQSDGPIGRRRQVIGGDLTGISKRRRQGDRLGRFRSVDFVNWIAGIIVLMIVAAFFWPQPGNESIKEVAGTQQTIDSAPFYSESRVDEEQDIAAEQSITRETDIDRAAAFRAQEAKENQIRALLSKAEVHLENGEYSVPASGNAADTFQQILKIESNNVKARQGLEYINGRFLATGKKALSNDNPKLATSSLKKIGSINSESAEYSELADAISSWELNRQIDKLLASAKQAVASEKLILPAQQNALYYYREIIKLDDGNKAAVEGIQSIADLYIEKANAAILAGEFEAANGYLATVSVIDAEHPSIAMIREIITSAKPDVTSQTEQPAPRQPPATTAESNTDRTTELRNNAVSSGRTPGKEAREQEAFDQQYLQRGLNAYYLGDYQTAAALLKPLADKGVSRAQFRIAYMYFLGRGFPQDRQAADRIIRAALPAIQTFAAEGRAWAQSDLGSLYEDGLVLPRDYSEAVYWYRAAAEQGYPGAQTNLGIMYARGQGVSTSRRTAIEWFQRAAKQGDVSAKRNLEALGITP